MYEMSRELSLDVRSKLSNMIWLLRGTCKDDGLFEMYLEHLSEVIYLLTHIRIKPDELEHLMFSLSLDACEDDI